MEGDDIMKLILVGLCTVGVGALTIGGRAALKEMERQKKRSENQETAR